MNNDSRKPGVIEKAARRSHEDGDCLIWDGCAIGGRHPIIRLDGKLVPVRRAVWAELHGSITHDRIVRATCGSPLCINPEHMVLTTRQALMLSLGPAVQGGLVRSATVARAKRKLYGKLNDDAVRDIRSSNDTTVFMAAKYGVSQSLVSNVRAGKAWRDYTSPFAGLGARI